VTRFYPCALPRHPVRKTRKNIVVHVTSIFLSEKCFQNHVTLKVKGKLVCQWRHVCRNCSYLVTYDSKHECFKKICTFCNKRQPSGHLCYVAPLKPSKLSNRYMYVFFDTECTQDLKKRDGSFEHVPNLICVQQMCCKCEAVEDVNVDCEQCGKRVHSFWQDPVGKFIDYQRMSRPFVDKIWHFTQLSWIRRTVSN
jgi:hypothetical protein